MGKLVEAQQHLSPAEKNKLNMERYKERALARQLEDKGWTKGILKAYGLSRDAYVELLEKQDYKCPFCGKEHRYEEWVEIRRDKVEGKHVRDYLLVVDHDHETGKVRGLLCGDCNILEGLISKALKKGLNPQAFIDYTRAHKGSA